MSFETLHNAIRSRFQTQVETPNSYLVQYDNAVQPDVKTAAAWIRFTVLPAGSEQVSLGSSAGNRRHRTVGAAIAQIFTTIEQGDKAALVIADKIVAAFQTVTASGVTYREPNVSVIGLSNSWWQVNVTCPFYADTIV